MNTLQKNWKSGTIVFYDSEGSFDSGRDICWIEAVKLEEKLLTDGGEW